jgi:hypothetical protein
LFAPVPKAAAERGPASLAAGEYLAAQAEQLGAQSDDLTEASAACLISPDPVARAQAPTDLLAKALSDLQVSALLYQAALDEEGGQSPTALATARGAERASAVPAALENYLGILLHEAGPALAPEMTERGGSTVNARADLSIAVVDALKLILSRAATTGQEALKGLAAIGVGNLGQAAGVVGMSIAQYLGQAEKVSRLYSLFRDFVIRAHEALLALVGNQLAQTMAGKVVEWLDEVQQGRRFEDLLEWLYQTGPTGRDLSILIKDSKAPPGHFRKALQEVAALEGRVRWNLDLASKFAAGLRFLGGVPAAALPQGQLLLAASYIVLETYVILAGGDAVDAPRLNLFDYAPGVRRIVDANLNT